mmetsp:Transcript_10493/g.34655  ORF Transcript_10493/g.34655 Transcript_10493/m.34655 type:complete len:175 (-) Transcript_10493:452-976(-)
MWQQPDDEAPTPDPYASRGPDWDPSSSPPQDEPEEKKQTKQEPSSKSPSNLVVKCGATALVNGAIGGAIGGVVGAVMGTMDAQQYAPQERGKLIGYRAGHSASQFGSFLAGYTGIRCTCAGLRRKDDLWNAGIAAGSVSALSALRTGARPLALITTATVSGALMMFIEATSHRG